MAVAARQQKATSIAEEVLSGAVVKRATTKTAAAEPEAEKKIQENTFYNIIFSPSLTPEQKREEIAKALTFAGSREQMRERIQEFEGFKEYLQLVREEMAKEIIELTNTDTFAELQRVYDELNSGVLDFEDRMKPLTDIIDALHVLRTNEKTMEAFREYKEYKEEQERIKGERYRLEQRTEGLETRIRQTNEEIAVLSEERSFFGLGGIKKKAREEIARQNLALQELQDQLRATGEEVSALNTRATAMKDEGEFAEQKAKLRELLDISTDEHKTRQKALVDAALNFVTTAKTRVGEVRRHLGKMNDQVDNLYNANGNMSAAYAILNEGIKGAEGENQKVRETLLPPESEEDLITKMQREQKKMDLEDHMGHLNTSAADTMATHADLTSQTVRIKDMRDANTAQINRARSLHTQGVAAVADRLSTVLQAVSGAALGESSAMAKETLTRVNDSTNKIAMKESIRVAMGYSETSVDLQKAIEDLDAYGEVVRAGTDIQREAVVEMRTKLEELKKVAADLGADIKESVAVHAKAGLGVKDPAKSGVKLAGSGLVNPFASR